MAVLVILHGTAAALLVVAGAAKLARPQPAADLLGALGLAAKGERAGSRPGDTGPMVAMRPLTRLLGCGEAAAGLAALASGGLAAAAVGAFYASFALVAAWARRSGAGSCGCFGPVAAPASRIHAVGNLAFAAVSLVAAGAASSPAGLVADAARSAPQSGITLVLAVGVLAGLVLVAFTALPEALHARSGSSGRAEAFRVEPGSLRRYADRPEAAGRRA